MLVDRNLAQRTALRSFLSRRGSLAAPTLRTRYLAANPRSAMDEGASAKGHENGLIIVDRVIFYWSELLPELPRLTTRLEKATALASAMLHCRPIDRK